MTRDISIAWILLEIGLICLIVNSRREKSEVTAR